MFTGPKMERPKGRRETVHSALASDNEHSPKITEQVALALGRHEINQLDLFTPPFSLEDSKLIALQFEYNWNASPMVGAYYWVTSM